MLWSSIVIILFVSFAHFIIISLSNGFIVWTSITLTFMPFSFNTSCAFKASETVTPVAIMLASVPSPSWIALPISNFILFSLTNPSSYITGVASLDNLTYTGPFTFAISFIAHLVWTSSDVLITIMFGRVLIMLISSSIWCVAPSSPTVIPACVAHIFTLAFVCAIVFLIWS